jgi:tartrate dehydrogenase/decarboxylase/D-malate dehydrogenase
VVIRENTEGEYSSLGGRMFEAPKTNSCCRSRSSPAVASTASSSTPSTWPRPRAQARHLGHQVQRHRRQHAVLGRAHRRHGRHYPEISWDKQHIDILCARFVLQPERFDVVVASNLFGDILSDLGPACAGTIGIAPSANLNPERKFPSLFEPVHGSAPDIYGQHRQPDRDDLVGRADARLPRQGRRRRTLPAAHDDILKAIEP